MPRPRSGRTHKPPYDVDDAVSVLSAADPKLAKLIELAGPFTLRLPSQQSPFEALSESIIYQQLHGKAAATIHARLLTSLLRIAEKLESDHAQRIEGVDVQISGRKAIFLIRAAEGTRLDLSGLQRKAEMFEQEFQLKPEFRRAQKKEKEKRKVA